MQSPAMQLETWVGGRQNPGMAEAMFSRFDHTGSGVLEATAVKPGWKQSRAG